MRYFGTMYLDKEKDIEVLLETEADRLYYTVSANNHRDHNLINNLARVAQHPTAVRDGRTVMQGQIPCYIKGDGQRVYVFRINGLKLANIYPDGKIEVKWERTGENEITLTLVVPEAMTFDMILDDGWTVSEQSGNVYKLVR